MFKIYLDIGPLQERDYTGISQVTVKLAEAMLADIDIDARFMHSNHEIPREIVETLVAHRNGSFFRYHFEQDHFDFEPIQYGDFEAVERVACIFPNTKTCRNLFPIESQIIHDLSTLLVPQYHTQDTIRHHAYSLVGDLSSNDVTFCVSKATQNDVIRYFGLARETTQVCYLGSDSSSISVSALSDEPPYIVVLGTLEPRKNLRLLFEMLKRHPELLNVYRIKIIGRMGWGEDMNAVLGEYGLASEYARSRIDFLGFVPEAVKIRVLRGAEFLVYPSMFEGFGLPVLEALNEGVPVITSFSSSLPEVGGDVAYYCDPTDADTLWSAMLDISRDLFDDRVALRERCLQQSARFSWSRFYDTIKSSLYEAHQRKNPQ